MILTKAIIKQTYNDDNHYLVYIPLLRKANDSEESATLQATCIFTNGLYNTYNVDDVVYVGFEDGEFDRPVIVGSLFLNPATTDNVNINTLIDGRVLHISDKAELPINTKLANVYVADIQEALLHLEDLQHKVNSLEIETTQEIYNDTTHITNYTFEDNTEYTYQLGITSPYDDLTLIIPETIKQGFISVINLNNIVSNGVNIRIQNNSNYTLRILDSYNRVVTSSSVHLTAGRKIIFCRCDGYYAEISIIEER